ncbi:hypothetical protein ACPV5U_23640 [Vibrio mediterranei]
MYIDFITTLLTLIAAIAAVISAAPIIRNWLPIRLTKKEYDVLQLADLNSQYPNTILYAHGAGRAYAQAPFKHDTTIYTSDEIMNLLSKKLLVQIHTQQIGSYIGEGTFIWFMLTDKGLVTLRKQKKY